MALGYAAIGGLARGVYAMGGDVDGRYTVGESGSNIDQEEFFRAIWPFAD